ncbi:MAG TPA: hypothetical protein VH760_01155 [Gaiellaceae bacterium]|jgi:hypothetical protein
MRTGTKTPLAALLQGIAAGAAGTMVFTGYQALIGKGEGGKQPRRWADAPEPAQVGKRVLEGVFQRKVTLAQVPTLTQAVHWAYGTGWGLAYAVIQESVRRPLVSGVTLATAITAADYTLLPLMKLYDRPWEYEPKTLVKDFGHHLVHGLAVAGAYKLIDATRSRSS